MLCADGQRNNMEVQSTAMQVWHGWAPHTAREVAGIWARFPVSLRGASGKNRKTEKNLLRGCHWIL